ncbi:hypothetical protein SAMN03084138_01953 [Enterovibrio norvegicus DSM 15893]|uniref:Uncharacterized protein n=1 Tax=Enterovibrio norvegicus DSM 15893 TaxID=1121869 RepID=A0A1I5PGB1_9GAMM|nr:hypothetical protein SAMN03084138_01953 [Enterovibrio norvegicus DSM 15893]
MNYLLLFVLFCVLTYVFVWPSITWALATIGGVLAFVFSKLAWVAGIAAIVIFLFNILS